MKKNKIIWSVGYIILIIIGIIVGNYIENKVLDLRSNNPVEYCERSSELESKRVIKKIEDNDYGGKELYVYMTYKLKSGFKIDVPLTEALYADSSWSRLEEGDRLYYSEQCYK